MPRTERIDYPGAVQHLFGRGNARQPIFRDEEDYRAFLARLIEFKGRMGVSVLAYCLMPNHYHLEARSGTVPISDFMQCLLQSYTRIFNDRWNSVGHVFQGRFGNTLCKTDSDVQKVMRYVNQNPVKAGLCMAPGDWPWSGHRGMLGFHDPILDRREALGFFEGSAAQYEDFLLQPSASDELRTLESIAFQWNDEELDLMKGRAKTELAGRLRREFIEEALREGHRRSAIARYLHRTPSSVTQLLANI
jgi:putative transposase